MKTTAVMIEILVAGVLVFLALFLLAGSLFPSDMQSFLCKINNPQHWFAKTPFLIFIFIPIAYGLGLLFEFIGLILVEWWLKMIKRKRIGEYYTKEKEFVGKHPIFEKYSCGAPKKIKESYHGEMRFYVLMKSSELYSIIETELNWLRLTRVLLIVEVILLFAIFFKNNPHTRFLLYYLIVIIIATVTVIRHRFRRYCRAIERSFKMLML
jgi:hypothetical protein